MITREALLDAWKYDKDSGLVTRTKDVNRWKAEDVVGSLDEYGYLKTRVAGRMYLLHRLIWLMEYGVMPDNIDHVNGIKDDNRLCNLRSVTHGENMKNKRLGKSNKSGTIGVNWVKRLNKWMASIRVNKKTIHLGTFNDKSEAVDARKLAEVAYGFHKNHGG